MQWQRKPVTKQDNKKNVAQVWSSHFWMTRWTACYRFNQLAEPEMGRTTSYYRSVGHTKIIQRINSCPSLCTAATNKEIHLWIVVITWIITEWVVKQTGASLWTGFASDSHQFFSITALGHMKYANFTWVFETCKQLNCNKVFAENKPKQSEVNVKSHKVAPVAVCIISVGRTAEKLTTPAFTFCSLKQVNTNK